MEENKDKKKVSGSELAERLGVPVYFDISSMRVSDEIYQKVPYAFAKRHLLLPIKEDDKVLTVATSDPLMVEPIEELRWMVGKEISLAWTPEETLILALNECYNQQAGSASDLIKRLSPSQGREDDEVEVHDLLDERSSRAPIIRLLNLILKEAIQQGASDIHFEPHEERLRVRYRVDGVLQTRHLPSQEYQAQLLTRIKVMAKLDIAERRLPQDGRIKLRMGHREIDFRVSTVPVSGGERIVLRILDKGNILLGLDNVGMLPSVYKDFRRLIEIPEGIVLVTGPTGSGKTTTLYSSICEIASEDINIMTIEDPVEYNLKGIAQIGVQPKIKLDFAAGLRHILRQDPDIIMIGEIRDLETAEIAIQASLTGHLVFSTLHTNDAPSAITRLVDMGIEPYLLSSSIIGVMAQRLVRKICPECRESYTPSDHELAELGLDPSDLNEGVLWRGVGCDNCFGSGYKGRAGLYELMIVNNAIRKQIVKSPDSVAMRQLALDSGMKSLLAHGALLVKNGITSVAEVLRTTRGLEDQD